MDADVSGALGHDVLMLLNACGESLPPFWLKSTRRKFRNFVYDVLHGDCATDANRAAIRHGLPLTKIAQHDPFDCFVNYVELESDLNVDLDSVRIIDGGLIVDGAYESLVKREHLDRLQLIAATCQWVRTLNWLVKGTGRLYAPATLAYDPRVLSDSMKTCPIIVDADMRYGTEDGEVDREYTRGQLQDMWSREKPLLWKIIARKVQSHKKRKIEPCDSAYEGGFVGKRILAHM